MTDWRLPLSDLQVSEEDVQAVLECYRQGWLSMGPRIHRFEEEFARVTGAPLAIAVASGTAALHLSLLAAGIGPGDEVILPALTFVAAAGAVRACGGEPVLCDIVGLHDLNLDPADVAARVTPRTKAIIATHWHGYVCDMPALQAVADEHGLTIIEDAAQAVLAEARDGRQAGSLSTAGCFSLFSKKQLCVGEGGMVVTADEAFAAKVRSLRSHAMTSVTWDRHRGHAETYDIVDIGFNYRMDEPRAALGLSRLPRLAADIANRRAQALAYRAALAEIDGITFPWDDDAAARSSHFAFAAVFASRAERDRVRGALTEARLQTTWYPAITMFSEYAGRGPLPRAEAAAERHLALPLSSTYTLDDVALVADVIRDAMA